MKKAFALLAISGTVALAPIQAATTFTGIFTLAGGSEAEQVYNGVSITDVTVSNLKGVGVTYTASAGRMMFNNWGTGATTGVNTFTGSIDLNKYIEFSLTATAGTTIDMTSLDFGIRRSATGTRQFEVRSSVDGFAAALSNYSTLNGSLLNSSGVVTNPDPSSTTSYGPSNVLSLSTLTGLSSVTFRFYFYNSEISTGTGGLQGPITFTGATVPEPSAFSLLAVGLGGLAMLRRNSRA